jgi:hypothetical protein
MQQKTQKQTMQEPKKTSRMEKRKVGEVMGFLSFFLTSVCATKKKTT